MGLSYQKMAQLELHAALEAARGERSHRGQCQALAWVARYARDQQHVRKTAEAATHAAAREEDLYNAIFPLAWPIRALMERSEVKAAAELLTIALQKSDVVTPAASRSEAVFLLFQAVALGSDRLWEPAFEKLALASLPSDNWRQTRNMRDAILIAATMDWPYAKAFADKLEDEKLKLAVLARMKESKLQPPRPFFW
jgi:hypothetical protein